MEECWRGGVDRSGQEHKTLSEYVGSKSRQALAR